MSTTDTEHRPRPRPARPARRTSSSRSSSSPSSDADRAKQFYASLGWREDADFPISEGFRVLQFTPPGSQASIIFGTGVTRRAARLGRQPRCSPSTTSRRRAPS